MFHYFYPCGRKEIKLTNIYFCRGVSRRSRVGILPRRDNSRVSRLWLTYQFCRMLPLGRSAECETEERYPTKRHRRYFLIKISRILQRQYTSHDPYVETHKSCFEKVPVWSKVKTSRANTNSVLCLRREFRLLLGYVDKINNYGGKFRDLFFLVFDRLSNILIDWDHVFINNG